MREKPRDKGRLLHILQAIDNIEEFRSGVEYEDFMSNKLLFYAIVKNVEIVGEAVYMLTKDFKESHPELPWVDIANMRHVLVHDYYNITAARIWDTINNDLVELRRYVNEYVKDMPDTGIVGQV